MERARVSDLPSEGDKPLGPSTRAALKGLTGAQQTLETALDGLPLPTSKIVVVEFLVSRRAKNMLLASFFQNIASQKLMLKSILKLWCCSLSFSGSMNGAKPCGTCRRNCWMAGVPGLLGFFWALWWTILMLKHVICLARS